MPASGPTVRSLALRIPAGARLIEHAHDWAQVVYATRGALAVETASMRWVVPPLRCLWVPPGVAHRVETIGEVLMRTIYIRPDRLGTLAAPLRVLDVSPLMRELLLEVVRVGALDDKCHEHRALAVLVLAQIRSAPQLGLALALPVDPRARAVADRVFRALRAGGEDAETLAALTRGVGVSPRSAERLFSRETGMSFGRWRQQARLQFAVRRLGERTPVSTVALECGYDSVSAFVSMFKRALGTTPGRYCASVPPALGAPALHTEAPIAPSRSDARGRSGLGVFRQAAPQGPSPHKGDNPRAL